MENMLLLFRLPRLYDRLLSRYHVGHRGTLVLRIFCVFNVYFASDRTFFLQIIVVH